MATALITGGTSGIGAAFARALAARGDDLVLVARNPDRLSDVATELKERHAVNVETIIADLAVRDEVIGIAERLTSTEQPIDMLINNAGFGIRAKLTDPDTTPHEDGIDVMIRAVLMLERGCWTYHARTRSRHDHQRLEYSGLRGHGQLLSDQDLGHGIYGEPGE